MKIVLSFCTIILLSLSCCKTKAPQSRTNTAIVATNRHQPSLDSVVSAIQNQYTIAIKKLKEDNINNVEISDLEISLKVSKTVSADGEFKVLIFKPSSSFERNSSTIVTYTLSKEKSEEGGSKLLVKDNELSEAIYQSAKRFNNLGVTVGNLTKDNFSLDIAFSIKWSVGGALEFDLWGISADVGAKREKEVEHGLKLTFELKKIK